MNRDQDPIDTHVGQRLKARRQLLGFSQEKLGSAVGVSFQQVQKYESGANRVGASRLMQLAKVLGTSVAYFFEGFSGDKANLKMVAEDKPVMDEAVFQKKETIDLLKAFYALPEATRPHVLKMVKALNTEDAPAKPKAKAKRK
ncbi:MAG TPA: helix-turn-helix domain-containing protein [Alphaproteobacteria bacterium]|nr:helix-turn-helix domain-containing protein [Alphaproteobacteria bacterium]